MAAEGDGRRVVLVRDDGSTDEVAVRADQTILSATDDADVPLRHGCREGRCASCTARLLEGEVDYLTEPRALSDRLRAEGFVLLCVARPATDCRVAVGRGVLADAFPGLWRTEG